MRLAELKGALRPGGSGCAGAHLCADVGTRGAPPRETAASREDAQMLGKSPAFRHAVTRGRSPSPPWPRHGPSLPGIPGITYAVPLPFPAIPEAADLLRKGVHLNSFWTTKPPFGNWKPSGRPRAFPFFGFPQGGLRVSSSRCGPRTRREHLFASRVARSPHLGSRRPPHSRWTRLPQPKPGGSQGGGAGAGSHGALRGEAALCRRPGPGGERGFHARAAWRRIGRGSPKFVPATMSFSTPSGGHRQLFARRCHGVHGPGHRHWALPRTRRARFS